MEGYMYSGTDGDTQDIYCDGSCSTLAQGKTLTLLLFLSGLERVFF